jgi:serine/threonine protein kinase
MTEFGDSFTAETFTGTLAYMSPERIKGSTYSYPSDIWSLGIVLLTFSTGKLPFPKSNGYWEMVQSIQSGPTFVSTENKQIKQQFSLDFYEFVQRMVEIDPIDREGI